MTRFALLLLVFASGCTLKYTIKPPESSALRYQDPAPLPTPQLTDARAKPVQFSQGRLKVTLKFEGSEDELGYLQKNLLQQLAARGVQLTTAGGTDALRVNIREFGIRNHRVSSFSPMVTYTRLSADVERAGQRTRVAAYSKQNKVPVWSMGELEGPCFNRPLHIVVGELAAKINRLFIGARSSDAELHALVARSVTDKGEAQLRTINELGFSNHPGALKRLTELASDPGEGVRGAALGAIGTLGMPESFGMLRGVVVAGASHTDRDMALKAIGDLGTPEALAYLSQVQASADGDMREIIRLYLEARPASTPALVSQAAPAP